MLVKGIHPMWRKGLARVAWYRCIAFQSNISFFAVQKQYWKLILEKGKVVTKLFSIFTWLCPLWKDDKLWRKLLTQKAEMPPTEKEAARNPVP